MKKTTRRDVVNMIAKPKSEYYFPVLIHAVFEPLVVYHRHRKHNRHYMNIAISKTFGIATAQKGKKKIQDGVMIKAQSNFFLVPIFGCDIIGQNPFQSSQVLAELINRRLRMMMK